MESKSTPRAIRVKDSINILGVEVDSKLSFDRHLESVAHKASLRVTLLRRVRHLLDAKGLMTLYKAQLRPIMEYSPPQLDVQCPVPPLPAGQAQVQQILHLTALWIPWRSERTTRAVVSDTLLEVPFSEVSAHLLLRHCGVVEHLHLSSGCLQHVHPVGEVCCPRLVTDTSA
ncbi:hypothetical protein E2C01_102486 [Portunus trituberculatus]|uniref:Uncharacterized protein n=1 Tax=Portunus trituberculatus TaxID=210409 RepID=A0A5B7KCR3_PORTR|nr:hypothetical protein [Portunus trituberculatus]